MHAGGEAEAAPLAEVACFGNRSGRLNNDHTCFHLHTHWQRRGHLYSLRQIRRTLFSIILYIKGLYSVCSDLHTDRY